MWAHEHSNGHTSARQCSVETTLQFREVTMYVVGEQSLWTPTELCTISLCQLHNFFFFAKKNDPAETSSCVWNSAHAKRNMFVHVWMAALREIGLCSQNNTSQTQRLSKNLFFLYTAVQHQETQGCAQT